MKKILILLALVLLFVPSFAFANFAATWEATSTTQGIIRPSRINGIDQAVFGTYFVGTTTATSTLGGGLSLKTGCFAINDICLTSGGSGTVNSGTTAQAAFYAANGTTVSGTSSIKFNTAGVQFNANVTQASGTFNTKNNTLDDGAGGAAIAGILQVNNSGIASSIALNVSDQFHNTPFNVNGINDMVTTFNNVLDDGAGRMGIGTGTPGTILSLGNTGANTSNFSVTSTSTLATGINIKTGCLAYNGICITQNSGSVTSISGSGGSTGLTLTGGPITTSGTLTLGGTLAIANGGTNATSFATNSIIGYNGTSLIATGTLSTLTVPSITASTTATSTFNGAGLFTSPLIAVTSGNSYSVFPTTPTRNDFTGTVGMSFIVSHPISVSQLGRLYTGASTNNHVIKLWSSNNQVTALSSGTILAASGSDAHGFKYVSVTPVTLSPGNIYYISIDESAGGDSWINAFTPTLASGFTDTNACFGSASSFPGTCNSAGQMYDTPSMVYSDVVATAPNASLTSIGTTTDSQSYSLFAGDRYNAGILTARSDGAVTVGPTASTLGSLTVNQTYGKGALLLNGLSTSGSSDPGGAMIFLTLNQVGNRQVVFGNSDTFGTSNNSAFRFLTNTGGIATIDGITPDGSSREPIDLGTDDHGVVVGNNLLTYNTPMLSKLAVYPYYPYVVGLSVQGSNSIGTGATTADLFDITNSGTQGDYFNVRGSGAVGIGTTSPFSLLSVTASSSAPTTSLFAIASSTKATLLNVLGNGNVGVGTTSPYASFSVQSGASTGDAFVVATSSQNAIAGFDNDGHMFTSGPVPTITNGTDVGDDISGTITTNAAVSSVTLTFAKAYRNAPTCNVTDDSLTISADVSSISTTAVTFSLSAPITTGHLYYRCTYHK